MGTGFFQNLMQKLKDGTSRATENHQLAGVKYYTETVLSLARPNANYSKSKAALQRAKCINTTVPEYTWPVRLAELEPEPDNPHDPNAIKVTVAGQCIGYIKAGSCARIHKLLREDRIVGSTVQLGGGRGKILIPDDSSSSERYVLQERDTVYWADLTLHIKPEK